MPGTVDDARTRRRRRRDVGVSFLELLALSGLAFAQPILEAMGKSPETFVSVDATAIEVVLLALAIVLLPPLLLLAVELLVGCVRAQAGRAVHLVSVGVLGAIFGLRLAREVTGGPKRLVAGALLTGAVLVVLLAKSRLARAWVRLLALAPAVFAVLFVLNSPLTAVAFGDEDVEPARVEVRAPASVVVLVFDELPTASLLDGRGRIDEALFPNFARLESDAAWYRNHTTVAANTPEAVPAIVTGQRPERMFVAPVHANHPDSIFTLLARTHDLNVYEPYTQLCPPHLCGQGHSGVSGRAMRKLFAEAFDVGRQLTVIDRRTRGFLQADIVEVDEQVADFERFVGSLRASERPSLDFAHLMLPHSPFVYLPDGRRHNAPAQLGGHSPSGWHDAHGAAVGQQLHVLQLQYVDRLLGTVLDRLERLGTYDDSMVVVTADHGASFSVGAFMRSVADDPVHVVWTPLFVKAPQQRRGEMVDAPVSSVDVLPTIADHLGVDLRWQIDGRSALGPATSDRSEVRVFGPGGPEEKDRYGGGTQRIDGEEGFDDLMRKRPPFAGSSDLRVYRVGDHGSIVGRRPSDFLGGSARGVTGRVEGAGSFGDLDLDGDEALPTYVSGTVRSAGPIAVAIEVNGVIAGWSPTYLGSSPTGAGGRGEESRRFQANVPPSLLRQGKNDVRLFRIEARGEAVALEEIRLLR